MAQFAGNGRRATLFLPTGETHNAHQSTPKSNSTKGGSGFNIIRFEGKKGKEQIFIHAENNHDVRVKSDSYEWVGNERHLIANGEDRQKPTARIGDRTAHGGLIVAGCPTVMIGYKWV